MPTYHEQLDNSPGELLTIYEAAQRMNVDAEEVEDMIRNNTLTSVTIAGEHRVPVSQLDQYTSSEIEVASLKGSNEEVDAL